MANLALSLHPFMNLALVVYERDDHSRSISAISMLGFRYPPSTRGL